MAGSVSLSAVIICAIGLSLAAQGWLALARQVNWDEFYYLAHVHAFARGDLAPAFQTFHVHLFGWLTWLGGGEIAQVVAGRLVMLIFEAGILALIFLAARRFVSREAALLGALSFAACSSVVVHGAAFRADPLATVLLMVAVVLMLAPKLALRHAALVGIALALAGLVTVKSVFYLPVVLAIALWRLAEAERPRALFLALAAGGALSAAVFALLYGLHTASLATSDAAAVVGAAAHSVDKVFDPAALARTWRYLAHGAAGSPVTFSAFALGLGICLREATRGGGGERLRWLALVAFAFPAATLLFYRNSFPYYHVFALAPACVLAAVAFERIPWMAARRVPLTAFMALLAAVAFVNALGQGQQAQRATLAAVHGMFPDPVPYIDRSSMVARFPKAGFFMSSWGMENYRAAGRPVLKEAIDSQGPRFVLANSPVLREALVPGSEDVPPGYQLLEADALALRDTYVHHWGPIWVAGKAISGLAPGETRTVRVAVPGPHTVETTAPVMLDGTERQPGEVVALDAGGHTVRGSVPGQGLTLRWGDRLMRPDAPEPPARMFDGF